jgi:hypothetical protein
MDTENHIESFPHNPEHEQDTKRLPGAFELFGPSWKAFKLNAGTFVLGVLIPILLFLIPIAIALIGIYASSPTDSYGNNSSHTAYNVIVLIFGILGVVALAVFFLPFIYMLKLQSAMGNKITFKATLKHSRRFVWRMLGLYILRSLAISFGFLLLIVPGFYMWRRYMLAPFYLIDEDSKVLDAMKKSAEDSKPFSYALWGMIGVYVLIQLIGIVPLVGWLISGIMGIVYCCAQAIRYLQIKRAKS